MLFDILNATTARERGRWLMESQHKGALALGLDSKLMEQYKPRPGSVLVLYGMGGDDRLPHAKAHMAAGGTVVSWDAGYWERQLETQERKYRVSINGFHPPKFVMRGESPGPARWLESGLQIHAKGGDPAGPIMLVGNAPKSISIGAAGWTEKKSRELRATFPNRKVLYRPKPNRAVEGGVLYHGVSTGAIDEVLKRVSLVVCKHSNVAVDACRMGVPVVCDDGAAAAIYPRFLDEVNHQPSAALRRDFLHRLAWWQWSPDEAERGDAWTWLLATLQANLKGAA